MQKINKRILRNIIKLNLLTQINFINNWNILILLKILKQKQKKSVKILNKLKYILFKLYIKQQFLNNNIRFLS